MAPAAQIKVEHGAGAPDACDALAWRFDRAGTGRLARADGIELRRPCNADPTGRQRIDQNAMDHLDLRLSRLALKVRRRFLSRWTSPALRSRRPCPTDREFAKPEWTAVLQDHMRGRLRPDMRRIALPCPRPSAPPLEACAADADRDADVGAGAEAEAKFGLGTGYRKEFRPASEVGPSCAKRLPTAKKVHIPIPARGIIARVGGIGETG